MKTLNLKLTTLLIVVSAIIWSGNLFAQRGYGRGNRGNQGFSQGYYCDNIPGITDEQKQKIETLRTANMKDMLAFRNQITNGLGWSVNHLQIPQLYA